MACEPLLLRRALIAATLRRRRVRVEHRDRHHVARVDILRDRDLRQWIGRGAASKFQRDLAERLNSGASSGKPPAVVPPIYGGWYAARSTVDPNRNTWLEELNLNMWRLDNNRLVRLGRRTPGTGHA